MTTPGYINSGNKLDEGKTYLFGVLGLVMLQDERAYLILEDPYHIKHLLPSWLYTNYNIEQGQTIKCLVDKINCTGRVYLEPEHPVYSIGCVYIFPLRSVQKHEQRKKCKLTLTDTFENEIEVECLEEFVEALNSLDFVSCTVMRIRKGKPVLALEKQFKEQLKNRLTSRHAGSVD